MFSNSVLRLFWIIGVIILCIILSLLIKLPYDVNMPGKIFASSEWIVLKGNNGQLITQLNNRESGVVKNYSVQEFERGDNVSFTTLPIYGLGTEVKTDDTIGYVYSNEIQRQIILLKGQIKIARANLQLNLSGEKESIINEAQENLTYQKRKAEEQRKILARKKALFESNLISQQEYEIAEGTAALNDIEISIAEAQLKSALSGAKNQQVDLIKQKINAYEDEIAVWQNRLSDDKLICPISGLITQMTDGDTLFVISDTSAFVILIPIKLQEKEFIKPDDIIKIELPFGQGYSEAKLKTIGHSVHYVSRTPVVYGTAIINDNANRLMPDMLVKCYIETGSVTVFEHLKRMMNHNIF